MLCHFRPALLLACAALSACASTARPPEERSKVDLRALDSMFEDVFDQYQLPGLALGIVKDGQVIYRRTAGELITGSGQSVTPDSLFKIASNSKAMTTALLARLVDQGKLRWDDPVIKHLPHFRMSDPWVTREMQVRDLLIHNSGLREGAGDLMFWPEPNAYTRADVIAGLAHLKLQDSFRSTYAYDNLLYVVAGEVAAAAGGAPYEQLIRRELFAPLEMGRCQAGEFRRDEIGNVAQPHMLDGDRNVVIRQDEALIPNSTSLAAGGIRCSLNDMLTWVRMWLGDDLHSSAGVPWLTHARRDELWRAHMPMPISQRQREWDGSHFNAYGYGWRLSDVDGVLRVAHTGTLAGMYSAVILLPEMNVGIVFMINGNGGRARTVLSQLLVKHFTAPDDKRRASDYIAELARESSGDSISSAPDVSARTPVAPKEFGERTGIYLDPWFGRVVLCPSGDRIEFRADKSPRLHGVVMAANEQLLVDWIDPSVDAEAWLHFHDASDSPALTLTKVDPEADFSYDYEDLAFARVGPCP